MDYIHNSSFRRECPEEWSLENFNLSSIPCPNCDSYRTLEYTDYIKYGLIIVLMTLAIFGNFSVLVAFLFTRTLRQTIDIYLANLAVAGLFFSMCCLPILMAKDVIKPRSTLSPLLCKLDPLAQMSGLTSTVLTLSAISCDRFIAIMFPFHSRVTKQRTQTVITLIWIISILVALPLLFVRKNITVQWSDTVESSCVEIWPGRNDFDEQQSKCVVTFPLKKIYYTFVTIPLFFLPIITMSTAYALIIWKLWITIPPGEHNLANLQVQNRAKRKVIRMVCIVLLVFVCCWAPLQALLLYSTHMHSPTSNGSLPRWLEDWQFLPYLVAYSNSAMNPVIYGGFDRRFRKALGNCINCSNIKPLAARSPGTNTPKTVTDDMNALSMPAGRSNGISSSRLNQRSMSTYKTEIL
ncbi:QRFP-like peptide receptor isoform X2 [Brevipalpus obovatus]|uniref:QRFP-like peptide receptor isoform X2 n=1 Tax=Brevipalpus obovatus TaxID=246614 RepID=UPI003D9EE3A7